MQVYFSILKKYDAGLFLLTFLSFYSFSFSQINCDEVKNNELVSFLKDDYSINPIEGAKIIQLNQCKFLISAGIADASSSNLQVMSRIASVKARRGVRLFLGDTKITSDNIIKTTEIVSESDVQYLQNYFDYVREENSGFVNGMETLTAFKSADGLNYIYIIVQML